MPITQQVLAGFGPIVLVAMGTSATEGAGADLQDESYPALIAQYLKAAFPEREVTVLNKSVGGQTAYDMLQRMEEDVIALQPSLLIWDTAMVDALYGEGDDSFARTLRKGISMVRNAGIDVLLVDLQWFPRNERYPQYELYRDALQHTAEELGVGVIPRYDLMARMSRDSMFRISATDGLDVLKLMEYSEVCLGRVISNTILHTEHFEELNPSTSRGL